MAVETRGFDPVDSHPFDPGLEVVVRPDAKGVVRRRIKCRRCGAFANAWAHRTQTQREAAISNHRATLAAMTPQERTRFNIHRDRVATALVVEPKAPRAPRKSKAIAEYHEFEPSGETRADKRGRMHPLCRCGAFKNAMRHRPPEARVEYARRGWATRTGGARVAADPVEAETSPTPSVEPQRVARVQPERIRVPPAELASLALAIDAVLALPADRVPWRLRMRLGEARHLVDIPTFPSLAADGVEAVPDAPSEMMVDTLPQLRPVARDPIALRSAGSLIRSIRNDRMRNLARRMIGAGWEPAMTGSGHLALSRGQRRLVISTTSQGGARSWANLRSDAKRLGVNVEGL